MSIILKQLTSGLMEACSWKISCISALRENELKCKSECAPIVRLSLIDMSSWIHHRHNCQLASQIKQNQILLGNQRATYTGFHLCAHELHSIGKRTRNSQSVLRHMSLFNSLNWFFFVSHTYRKNITIPSGLWNLSKVVKYLLWWLYMTTMLI